MSNVDIAYYDTDFFYKNKDICTNSNSDETNSNSDECQNNEYKAKQLFNITKTHIVSNERLHNMQHKYNDAILNTINLGIGILITGSYVLYKITQLK